MKRILVTGANGFLGRNTSALFNKKGCQVVGIGHGSWQCNKPEDFGIDEWIEADISDVGLSYVKGEIDCVIHCAGGSSVGASISQPYIEFKRTVDTTVQVLEYIRNVHPTSMLVYPSSAAVYGEKGDLPIGESSEIAPVSPYGMYKRIVENICEYYAVNFDLSISTVRFFSIYGAGLKKQLLWDACLKFSSNDTAAQFYGTGSETRDWIHVKDAAKLMYLLIDYTDGYQVFNGGSGSRTTIRDVLNLLSKELGTSSEFFMGNDNKPGDPLHYWADIAKISNLGWTPGENLENGITEYVQWFLQQKN